MCSTVTSLDTGSGIAYKGGDPRDMGHRSPRHRWDKHQYSLFLLTSVWVRGTSFSRRVLRKHLWQHRKAILARAWVEVEDRAFRPRLRRPGACLCRYTVG